MTMIPQERPTAVLARFSRVAVVAWILLGVPSAIAADEKPDPTRRADGWKAKSAVDDAAKRAETPATEQSGGKNSAVSKAAPTLSGHSSVAAEKAAIDTVGPKTSIDEILARTLPHRTDRPGDWQAGLEPLHRCGDPRWIDPCIPPPPCHPALPPHPYDLVGVAGDPTCGPIYAGPCCPRTGTHDDGPWPRIHRVHDRLFDAFYYPK